MGKVIALFKHNINVYNNNLSNKFILVKYKDVIIT